MNVCVRIVTTFLAVVLWADALRAAEGCCQSCGCHDGCEKVCRLVREDKKVSVTCWGCKCEDFCVPGKSHRGCKNYEEVCLDCDPAVCNASKEFIWFDWEPGCAKHIYTKKKLMRKTLTRTVPSFKWVVEELCPSCQDQRPCALIPAGSTIPPPPLPDTRRINGIALTE